MPSSISQAPTLLSAPIETLREFSLVVRDWVHRCMAYTMVFRIVVPTLLVILVGYSTLKMIKGPAVDQIDFGLVLAWWLLLGMLSSMGMGTGLHTFVLYLGPFVAKVTMAAEECRSLVFPTTGPDAFTCPMVVGCDRATPTILHIMQKVQLVCFMWGLGTALGELPPYFMARCAARTGRRVGATPTRSDEQHFHGKIMGYIARHLHVVFERFGFVAILLFASFPNPIFDLAGVTCGHFNVPFWTFFGATVVGKALVKVSLQALMVVYMFHEGHLEILLATVERLLPPSVCSAIDRFFKSSREQFHGGTASVATKPIVTVLWDLFLVTMLLGFLRSIIDGAVHERRESLKLMNAENEKEK